METDPPGMQDDLWLPGSSADLSTDESQPTAEPAGRQGDRRRNEDSPPPPTDADPPPDKHFEPL